MAGNNFAKTIFLLVAIIMAAGVKAAVTNYATLEHTGSTYYMNGETYKQTYDNAEERYAGSAGQTGWNGQAAMKFSFNLPAGKTVIAATLTWSAYLYKQNNGGIRNNSFYYLDLGKDIDWNAFAQGRGNMIAAMQGRPFTSFTNVELQDGQEYLNLETDVTTAVKAVESQGYITMFLTNCPSSADLYGKGSDYPPSLSITYADEYTVTFEAGDDATCATTSLFCASEGNVTSVTLPAATDNNGAEFMGWYTAPLGGTRIGGAGYEYTPNRDITLYAQYNRAPTGIAITGESTIKYGATTTLTATVTPSNTVNSSVTWSSDNTSVVTVDANNGVITTHRAGSANITATTSNNVSTTVTFTVESENYAYTVNAVDNSGNILKQLKTGTYATGKGNIDVSYPRYVLVEDTLYEREHNATLDWWTDKITPDVDGYVYNIVYSPSSVENVIYFTEAEDCEALTVDYEYTVRASNGSLARNASNDSQYREVTALMPGNYVLYTRAVVGNGSNQICNFKVGDDVIATFSYSNGTDRYAQQAFTLTEKKTLYVNCPMASQSGLDYFYIVQDTVYHVTQNLQQFNLTKENIDGSLYTTANPVNNNGSTGTHNGVTGAFYNIKWESNYVTMTFDGAIAFSIDAFHGNSKDTRDVKVYLDDKELTEFHVVPGNYTTSPIYSTGDALTHTVTITGAGKDVYPADIVFYTVQQVPKLDYTSAAVKVGETKNIPLRLPYGCIFNENAMTNAGDPSKVTATFTRELDTDNTYRKGTLTLVGIAATGNTPTNLTFSIKGNGTVYKDGESSISVDVLKAGLTLGYTDGDSGDDATEYVCNADENKPTLLAPTLTATDDSGNPVSLSSLNITYASDDATVATVDENGNITLARPYGNGTAIITATSTNNSNYDDAKAQYSITIQKGVNWKVATHPVFKDNAPAVRDTFHVYKNIAGKEELYVIGTFGGWNRNNNKYNYPQANGSTKAITDHWYGNDTKNKKISTSSTGVDGFSKYWSGAADASNETMYNSLQQYYNDEIYGVKRFGWFKQPDGNTTYPFTLPVRGAYITLEPEVNGTLSVYIEQNGPWNSKKNDVYDNDSNFISVDANGNKVNFPGNAPYQYRPHAFFIVDQNGNLVEKYTPVKIITRTKVKSGISTEDNNAVLDAFCEKYACEKGEKYKCILDENADGYNDVTNIGNWKEFKEYMSADEQQRVHDNWSAGVNGAQVVTKLDNGAYLALDPGMVKYTFHVIAGQTYYIFSNFSKIGFSGVNFVPDNDNQPSGELPLSEDKAYDTSKLKEAEGANTIPMYKIVTLDRSFTRGKWNTICLPFTMTEKEVEDVFGIGTELIILDKVSVDEGHASIFMKYHEIQNILAGYPYLIKPTQDVDHIEVHNKGIDPNQQVLEFTNNGYTSKGVTDFCNPQTFNIKGKDYNASVLLNTGDIFLSNNTLYISRGQSFLKGYRSYLKKEDDGTAPAKSVSFNYFHAWEEEEEATAINVCEMSEEAQQSLGVNEKDGVYSITGQKVSDTVKGLTKGIYVLKGRKVIVK